MMSYKSVHEPIGAVTVTVLETLWLIVSPAITYSIFGFLVCSDMWYVICDPFAMYHVVALWRRNTLFFKCCSVVIVCFGAEMSLVK